MPVAVKIRLHALRRDVEAAEAAARGVRLEPPSLPYPHYTMMVELARVELARLRDDYEGMLAAAEEGLAQLERILPGEAPQLRQCQADALLALGRGDDAREVLRTAETLSKHEGYQRHEGTN
jgi:hypothetical protein